MTKRIHLAYAAVCALAIALVVSAGAFVGTAHAATSAVYTATTVPTYQNPVTGTIEDSAGTSNVALAESMTSGCTYPAALVEKDTAGNTFVTLRFKLADQVGQMQFWADTDGNGSFAETAATQMQTDTANNTADYRFQVPSEASNVRVSMYVNPMGRAVIYFVSLTGLVEGNTDAVPFVQTITPGEEAAEPAATAAEPADSSTDSSADSASSASSEPAPSTDGDENQGIQEFNADGQEVTGEQDANQALDGTTTAIIVGVIVAIVVVAGAVSYVAYFKPKRAKQAAAAAAAASAAAPAAGAGPKGGDAGASKGSDEE